MVKPFYYIPVPTEVPYGRGIASTSGPNGEFFKIRITSSERARLDRAATKLGLSSSAFVRRVIYDMAEAVLKDDDEQE